MKCKPEWMRSRHERISGANSTLDMLQRCLLLLLLVLIIQAGVANVQGRTVAFAYPQRSMNTVGGCQIFPSDNIWNQDISSLPVHSNSANYMASIGLTNHLDGFFGSGLYDNAPIGFPYTVVPGTQPTVPVSFEYANESDPGPYPIPPQAPIEGGAQSTGDRHVLVINSATCKLYETFASYPQADGSWKAGSGAIWDLNSNALRPRNWTSADAAGLPIFAGLVRYDEIASGVITHALRFTVNQTQNTYIWPARHFASSNTDPNLPPMGLRLRLKADVNIDGYSPQTRIVLTALKHYGMIVADNGSCCFISGTPDDHWDNPEVLQLRKMLLSNFEVVDESSLQVSPDSAQSRAALPTPTPTPAAPTPTPTPLPRRDQVVIANSATPTSTQTIVAEDQKKRALVSPSQERAGWIIPLVVGIAAVLLLSGFWLRFRRSQRR
ncbi:hypothetical protein KTT_54450 [Tengunoibacter tsumagoiensis]|uniref:Uncharacterized protein n=1 Tax=Tengunoibacter tsumagoiensis TaxID=2014871 RepID=A0A402A9B1_9CHLR|nr:hypothetical protein [Tengunoibacter tsumagoiensis]GCE15586.1 hypothetical protein KTT_54450 [Tengunoibacter tsumagoiensis]